MTEALSTVRADFDRIALLAGDGWGHNNLYHDFLISHLPRHCQDALEVGCGTGDFSRRLAKSSARVLALDLSPNMIACARERSAQFPNIDYRVADVMTFELPEESFDCVATVATLHHLPAAEALSKLKRSLRKGGVLLVLDLFQEEGLADALRGALAVPLSVGLRLLKRGRLLPPREVRRAWDEHARHDTYLTLRQVRELCADVLPGAAVRRHLMWRYSVVWKRPA